MYGPALAVSAGKINISEYQYCEMLWSLINTNMPNYWQCVPVDSSISRGH